MAELLTESFCERCGTRYTFESGEPEAKRPGIKKARILARGLKNFVMSDDVSLDAAMAEAQHDEDRGLAALQLEAFHDTFNFCMDCRQYTCLDCWNEAEGRCLSCAPAPGHIESALYTEPEPVDGSGRLAALLAPPPATSLPQLMPSIAAGSVGSDVVETPAGAGALDGSFEAPMAATAEPTLEVPPIVAEPTLEVPPIVAEPTLGTDLQAAAGLTSAAGLGASSPTAPPPLRPYTLDLRTANLPRASSLNGPASPSPLDAVASDLETAAPPARSLEEALLAATGTAPEPLPVQPEPALEAQRSSEPVAEAEAEVLVEAVAEPEVEAVAEPEPVLEATAEPALAVEPAAEVEQAAEDEPIAPPVVLPGRQAPPLAPPIVSPLAASAPSTPRPGTAAGGPAEPPAAIPAAAFAGAPLSGWDVVAPEQPSDGHVSSPLARPSQLRDVQPAPWFAARANASIWEVSSAELVNRSGSAIQTCVSCGLPLSASAHFCRRCGSRQAA
jgi:ribosomal protein L40E